MPQEPFILVYAFCKFYFYFYYCRKYNITVFFWFFLMSAIAHFAHSIWVLVCITNAVVSPVMHVGLIIPTDPISNPIHPSPTANTLAAHNFSSFRLVVKQFYYRIILNIKLSTL